MDYNPGPAQMPPRSKISANGFLVASVICTMLAFITECSLPICMVFASLTILFAVLSKGKQLKMHSFAKMSIGISIFSIALSFTVTFLSFYKILTDPVERENFNQIYEEMYGITFDEALDEIQQLF